MTPPSDTGNWVMAFHTGRSQLRILQWNQKLTASRVYVLIAGMVPTT